MATWDATLRFKDFYRDGELTIAEKAEKASNAIIAKFVKILNVEKDDFDDELDCIALDFRALSADADAGADHFDDIMSVLYDWADEHRVWVETR